MFVCHVSCHCPVKFLSFHSILLYLPHLSKVCFVLVFLVFLNSCSSVPFLHYPKDESTEENWSWCEKKSKCRLERGGNFQFIGSLTVFSCGSGIKLKAGVLAHILLILMFEENTATDYMNLQTFLAKANRLRFFVIVQGSWYISPCADYISVILTSFNFFSLLHTFILHVGCTIIETFLILGLLYMLKYSHKLYF